MSQYLKLFFFLIEFFVVIIVDFMWSCKKQYKRIPHTLTQFSPMVTACQTVVQNHSQDCNINITHGFTRFLFYFLYLCICA